MTVGARRGELCGLRWSDIKIRHNGTGEHDCIATACDWWLEIRSNVAQSESGTYVKDTKTNRIRLIALDIETIAVLIDHRQHCHALAAALGVAIPDDGFVFSASPDGTQAMKPRTITQRYRRFTQRLNITTTLHRLRHYSATELITAGVDIRTVAGRLGHAGGGTTTLKVYAAWVSAADQRAALALLDRMPARPTPHNRTDRAKHTPQSPYELIATTIRTAILHGDINAGEQLPPMTELATQHNTAVSTVHRAIALLKDWGHVSVSRGKRAVVLPPPATTISDSEPDTAPGIDTGTTVHNLAPTTGVEDATADAAHGADQPSPAGRRLVDLKLLHDGVTIQSVRTEIDPLDASELRAVLRRLATRKNTPPVPIVDLELEVWTPGKERLLTTFADLLAA